MERFTKKYEDGVCFIESSVQIDRRGLVTGPAAQRMWHLEELADGLERQQMEIAKELAALRDQGKKNSVKFRELMGKKLHNSSILAAFKASGIQ